ncbi:MAG: GNAT family N-acetyltransferase [Mycobacteriales bacterium]
MAATRHVPLVPAAQAARDPALTRAALAAPRLFGAFARLGSAAERTHPEEPHWYLESLGVHPRRQGQGWGGQLVLPALERADATGLPCYVETSDARNEQFYRRLGFSVVDRPWTTCRTVPTTGDCDGPLSPESGVAQTG